MPICFIPLHFKLGAITKEVTSVGV